MYLGSVPSRAVLQFFWNPVFSFKVLKFGHLAIFYNYIAGHFQTDKHLRNVLIILTSLSRSPTNRTLKIFARKLRSLHRSRSRKFEGNGYPFRVFSGNCALLLWHSKLLLMEHGSSFLLLNEFFGISILDQQFFW